MSSFGENIPKRTMYAHSQLAVEPRQFRLPDKRVYGIFVIFELRVDVRADPLSSGWSGDQKVVEAS